MKSAKKGTLAVFVALALSAGCSTVTQVQDTWTAQDAASARLKKVLVVGMAAEETSRRQFEDSFVLSLRERGVQAVPSYQFSPTGAALTQDRLRDVVEKNDFDGVLITRLVGVSQRLEWVGGSAGPGFYDWYGGAWPTIYSRGYLESIPVAKMETRLFTSGQDGKLIWSATSQTSGRATAKNIAKGTAKKVTDRLVKQKVI
jgi:hypothetical protein